MRCEEFLDPEAIRFSTAPIRKFVGPRATEVFLLFRPDPTHSGDLALQTEAAYSRLREALDAEGGRLEHVVQETVFFRDIRSDLPAFTAVRKRFLQQCGSIYTYRPAVTFIEQPPASPGCRFEVLVSAAIPRLQGFSSSWNLWSTPSCGCEDCPQVASRVLFHGSHKYIFSGNIVGSPGTIFEEVSSMFLAAEKVLQQEGMDFRTVVRTWIYLRQMDDYAEFNRARSAFFRSAGLTRRPASTGIRGAPFALDHRFCMGFYAAHSPLDMEVRPMSTPTMNEAYDYGSDFSRGMLVREVNKVALYVSGTASVDEEGRTVHAGNFDAQARRMLRNISTLLAQSGASFSDVVSAVTYLKRPSDAQRLGRIFREQEIDGFPNAVVQAAVCRPELLCEMEAFAALPLDRIRREGDTEADTEADDAKKNATIQDRRRAR